MFLIQGFLINDRDYDVYTLYEKCIKNGHIARHINDCDTDQINEPEKSKLILRKTPGIPLFLQYGGWPVHCGELCEFTGTPRTYDGENPQPVFIFSGSDR